jgi:hypothetical protein
MHTLQHSWLRKLMPVPRGLVSTQSVINSENAMWCCSGNLVCFIFFIHRKKPILTILFRYRQAPSCQCSCISPSASCSHIKLCLISSPNTHTSIGQQRPPRRVRSRLHQHLRNPQTLRLLLRPRHRRTLRFLLRRRKLHLPPTRRTKQQESSQLATYRLFTCNHPNKTAL